MITFGDMGQALNKKKKHTEMNFWHRFCKLKRLGRIKHEEIRERMNVEKCMQRTIGEKRLIMVWIH